PRMSGGGAALSRLLLVPLGGVLRARLLRHRLVRLGPGRGSGRGRRREREDGGREGQREQNGAFHARGLSTTARAGRRSRSARLCDKAASDTVERAPPPIEVPVNRSAAHRFLVAAIALAPLALAGEAR